MGAGVGSTGRGVEKEKSGLDGSSSGSAGLPNANWPDYI